MTSESIDAKIRKSKILWVLPSIVIISITFQSLLQVRQIHLATVPVIGGLSGLIHNNALLSKAANEFFFQNTAAIAVVFLFFTLCWVLQYVATFKYGHREYAFGSSVFGSLFFIVLFVAVYIPLFELPGFVVEKILFFGIPLGVVASLVQSYRIFPWKEITIEGILGVLLKAKEIIRNTEEIIKTEIKKIGTMRIIDSSEILTVQQDIETSCRELLSEANAKEKEIGEKKHVSELNNLLIAAKDLCSRAEKNQKSIEDIEKSIRSTLIRKVDKMYADVMNLGSEMNCAFTLTNLPDYLREVNIPDVGNTNIEKVPDVLKSMIKDEKRDIQEFENIFSAVGNYLNKVKRHIEDNINALDYKKVEMMIKNADESIINIPNALISTKLKLLYIDNPTKYKELKSAKEKMYRVKEAICELVFEEAVQKLKEVKENIKVVNKQIGFINAMIVAVEKKWDKKKISIPNPDILIHLSEEFHHAYGAKYTTNKSTLSIHKDTLRIKYETIPEEEINAKKISDFHPNEVRAILYLLGAKRDKKERIVFLSKDDLPANAKRPEVLKEFKSFVREVLGEGVKKCDTKTNFVEIEFEENLDPVESINKIIEEHEKRW